MSKKWNSFEIKNYLDNYPGIVEKSVFILLKANIKFSQKELKTLHEASKYLSYKHYLLGTLFTKTKYICNKHINYLVWYANNNKNIKSQNKLI